MRLRPRQEDPSSAVLLRSPPAQHAGVAPTGAGKPIYALGGQPAQMIGDGAKACVAGDIRGTRNLTAQKTAPSSSAWLRGVAHFGDRTDREILGRRCHLLRWCPPRWRGVEPGDMPALDLLVIDEAHHAGADSYRRIIDRVRDAKSDARVFGVDATPTRARPAKGLREVFDNVGRPGEVGELIASGHLVPRALVFIDVGVQGRIESVRKGPVGDFDIEPRWRTSWTRACHRRGDPPLA